jgi:hypothetical protein
MIRLVNSYAKTNEHEDERTRINEQIRISMNGRKHRICVSEHLYTTNEYTR